MKKIVRVENIIDGRKFSASFIDDDEKMNNWIAKLEAKALKGIGWGHGPRSMSKSECVENELEILIIKEYQKEFNGKLIDFVDLKAEYEISIIDDSYNEELDNCYKSRKKEYGTVGSQLDEIFHGSLASWKKRIQAVKDKYPKPVK